MKLKCSHGRRVMVLPSSTTVHRSDGSKCMTELSIGGKKVSKLWSPTTQLFVTLGN